MSTAKILGQDLKILKNPDEYFVEGSSIVYPTYNEDIFVEDTIGSSLLEFDIDDAETNLFAVLKSLFKEEKEVVVTIASPDDDNGIPLVDTSKTKILFNADGTFSLYNPDFEKLAEAEVANVTFSYIVKNGEAKNGKGSSALVVREVTVEVTGTNEAPVIVEEEEDIGAMEDTVFSGQVVATDIDSDDDSTSLTYILVDGEDIPGFIFNTDGSYTIDANVLYQHLKEDEIVEYNFSWQAKDSHGAVSSVDDVKITITGTNDAPVVVAHSDIGLDEGDSINGQVVANDIDSDDNSTSLTYILVYGQSIPGFTFNADGTYSIDANIDAYKSLAKDETVKHTFKWQAEDSHGALSTVDTVIITVTGTNDLPVVAYSDLTAAVTELVTPVDSLSDSGTINFTDANSDDIHTISSITPSYGSLGALTAYVSSDTTGSGTGGVISWEYTVLASDVEYLAKDVTKDESFTITLDDGSGGLVNRIVVVTITGTNDAPMVVAHADIEVSEDTILSGQVVATDVDSDSLTYILLAGNEIPGFTFNDDGAYSIDTTVNAYQSLAKDETAEYSFRWQAEDTNGAKSAINNVKIIITGTNDAPTVTYGLTTYTFNLLQGATDVDHGAILHVQDIVEAEGKEGWSVHGNTMSIDSDLYQQLFLSGETETFSFNYQIVDENGASVSQSLNFEVEGKEVPSLSVTTSAGSSANIIMLTLTNDQGEQFNLNFDNLPAGALILDGFTPSNDVTAGVSGFSGTQTFQLILPENQDAKTDFSVTITGDTGAQNTQYVEVSYDVASSQELVTFSSQDQNIWGDFVGNIGWHEYIPFVGEVSQEWNAETKVWDDLDVDAWSSGKFNVVDIDINSNKIYDFLLKVPQGVIDLAIAAQTLAAELLQDAKDWLIDASERLSHITGVAEAWFVYGVKQTAYDVAKVAYDAGTIVFDAAEVVFDLAEDAFEWLEGAYSSAYTTWYNANQIYLDSAWTPWPYIITYYDPIKGAAAAAAWTVQAAAWTALNLGKPVYNLALSVFETAQDAYEDLGDTLAAAKSSVDAAYTHALNLENAMHIDGDYVELSHSDGDDLLIIGAVVLSEGEVLAAEVSVEALETAKLLADGAVWAAQESYDTAYALIEGAIDVAQLDFEAQLKVDATLYAQVGLQVDFELDLGSVDTTVEYMLTSQTQYNQTTDMLAITPTMTNMTTGDTVAYSTVSPNATFYVAILYDVWADLEVYTDGYLSGWHLEFIDGELVPVNGMIFDMSPESDDGITINTTISTNSWADMMATLPTEYLPDLPTDLEAGKLVLVDFDSTELEPFEVPFIDTITSGILNIEVAFPTVQTEGVSTEYTQSFFEEGGLVSVDFSEISSAIFNLINAELEYSQEFQDMYGLAPLADGTTLDDLLVSIVDAFLAVLWDNLDGQSTAAPIFVLDTTDETSTSLLHVNVFPDEVMTDTLSDDTASFGFYTSYGESDPVVKVTLDIDAIVAVILDKVVTAIAAAVSAGSVGAVLEAIPAINPLDIEFGIAEILQMVEVPEDVAEEITNFVDLSVKFEAADLDAYAQVDFSQEFSLSIDDMSYAVTLENGDVQYFSANGDGNIVIENASYYDDILNGGNGDGKIDYSLDIVPTAMFSNDTEVGLSMGYAIELLQGSLAASVTLPLSDLLGDIFPDIEISLADIAIGPLLTIEGDLDILDVDVFETRFALDIGSVEDVELTAIGITDTTMFIA